MQGIDLKLKRATTHIKAFYAALKDFRKSSRCPTVKERDPKTSENIWRLEEPPAQPDPALSPIVGDAIYNLRSALDHTVWRLVESNGQTPTQETQFPIWAKEETWPKEKARRLRGVNPEAQTIIEFAQPCLKKHVWRNRTLSSFRDLSNIDKHRHLHLVVSATSGGFFSHALPVSVGVNKQYFIYEGPVQKDTILARIPSEYVDVDFAPLMDIAFGQSAQLAEDTVYVALVSFRYVVANIIGSLRPFIH